MNTTHVYTLASASFLAAFLTAYFLTFACRAFAMRVGIVDEPGERKIHTHAMPLLGGLAIFGGVCAGLIPGVRLTAQELAVLLGAGSVFVVNLLDDTQGLSSRVRFMCEASIALGVVAAGVRVSFLPNVWWGDMCEIVLSLVWLVGVTNAVNYLDGMDGLAAGSAAVYAYFFAAVLFASGQFATAIFALILCGACLGFLPHNFPRARIFLGDAGSTFIGFLFAGVALAGNWAQDSIVKISIPILILGVPIFDMIFTTIMRIAEGKVKTASAWLAYAGRDHFHHSLVDVGLTRQGAVQFIWVVTGALGLSAWMVSNDRAWEAVTTLVQASLIFTIIGVLIVVGKKRRSGWQPGAPTS